MLRKNEPGVLSGSELFFHTVDRTQNLFYYVSLCGHYYCNQPYRIDRPYLDYLLFLVIARGTMKLTYREKEYTACAGDIVLFDCASPHCYFTAPSAEFYWVHFAGANSFELCAHLTHEHGSILYRTANNPKAAEQIHTLVRQFADNQLISDAEQSRLLYNALCYLMPGNNEGSFSQDGAVQQAVRYIQEHLSGDLSLKRLAAEVHISPSHFMRLFRTELRCSPHEYIIRCRMDRAKYLLKTTDLPIKFLASEVGYATESSFTGAFTEKIGLSPRKFRELPLG